jgi:hypothetical protein
VPDDKQRTFTVNYKRGGVAKSFDLTLTTHQIGGLKRNGSAVSTLAGYMSEQSGEDLPAQNWVVKAQNLLPTVVA